MATSARKTPSAAARQQPAAPARKAARKTPATPPRKMPAAAHQGPAAAPPKGPAAPVRKAPAASAREPGTPGAGAPGERAAPPKTVAAARKRPAVAVRETAAPAARKLPPAPGRKMPPATARTAPPAPVRREPSAPAHAAPPAPAHAAPSAPAPKLSAPPPARKLPRAPAPQDVPIVAHDEPAATAAAAPACASPAPAASLDLAGRLRHWAEGMLPGAETVISMARTLSEARQQQEHAEPAALQQAGRLLRTMREALGISVQAVADAARLRDPALVEEAERGKIALSFDAVIRLAGILGDRDPMGAASRLLRAYHPEMSKTLDKLRTIGFVMPDARERALLAIYRRNEAAHAIPDDDFDAIVDVLASVFVRLVDFRTRTSSG